MTIEEVTGLFIRDYLVMSYLGSLGAIQIGASLSGLSGLLFLRRPRASQVFGAMLILAGLAYFILAPLWNDGPWSEDPSGQTVRGAEGKMVHWGHADPSGLAEARNINDVDGGISGTGQALWFSAGAAAAVATTLLLSSLLHWRLDGPVRDPGSGIESLHRAAWFRAVPRSMQAWRSRWRDELAAEFQPDARWHPIRALVGRWRAR